MSESKFTIGQKVFDLRHGFGEIYSFKSDRIIVRFKTGSLIYFSDGINGNTDLHPTLLTLEQAKLLGHEPEKKKIVRKIERWINIYESGMSGEAHESKEDADVRAEIGRIACARVEGFYEIEE